MAPAASLGQALATSLDVAVPALAQKIPYVACDLLDQHPDEDHLQHPHDERQGRHDDGGDGPARQGIGDEETGDTEHACCEDVGQFRDHQSARPFFIIDLGPLARREAIVISACVRGRADRDRACTFAAVVGGRRSGKS
jgi:hypothetical protein